MKPKLNEVSCKSGLWADHSKIGHYGKPESASYCGALNSTYDWSLSCKESRSGRIKWISASFGSLISFLIALLIAKVIASTKVFAL